MIVKKNKITVPFSSLSKGDCFLDYAGVAYMVTETIWGTDCNALRDEYNAVNLKTGEMMPIKENYNVTPVSAAIEIDGEGVF